MCEVEKLKREKKLQGDKVAVGFNIIFQVWEADQPTADATADTTTRFLCNGMIYILFCTMISDFIMNRNV